MAAAAAGGGGLAAEHQVNQCFMVLHELEYLQVVTSLNQFPIPGPTARARSRNAGDALREAAVLRSENRRPPRRTRRHYRTRIVGVLRRTRYGNRVMIAISIDAYSTPWSIIDRTAVRTPQCTRVVHVGRWILRHLDGPEGTVFC